jgi:predicted RNA-binding protein
MCLSTVYGDSAEEPLCEYVTRVSVSDGTVTLTNVTGNEVAVEGRIRSVDLIKNVIVLEQPS